MNTQQAALNLQTRASAHSMRGVGMIEVLVTLFILSIGILGVASLQFISSFSNADALSRSQAVFVAQQLAERLRASAVKAPTGEGMLIDNAYFNDNNYNFNNLTCASSAPAYQCYCLTMPASIVDCAAGVCTQAEFAIYDAYQASCAAKQANPNIEIAVDCDDNNALDTSLCSSGSKLSIKLDWPTQNWQQQNRILNPACTSGRSDPYDCVVLDIVL